MLKYLRSNSCDVVCMALVIPIIVVMGGGQPVHVVLGGVVVYYIYIYIYIGLVLALGNLLLQYVNLRIWISVNGGLAFGGMPM